MSELVILNHLKLSMTKIYCLFVSDTSGEGVK